MSTPEPINEPPQEDMTLFEGVNSTKQIATGIILASVYAVMVMIPLSGFIAAVGVSSIISFAICIAPLFGVLLGPARGFGFGLVAGILATFVSIPFGGLYIFIPTIIFGPAIAGILGGLCLNRTTEFQGFKIPGPLLTALYLIGIAILYLIPHHDVWWFITPYILAACVALVFQFKKANILDGSNNRMRTLNVVMLAMIGTFGDFSMMTMGAVYLLGLESFIFSGIFLLMLLERSLAIFVSTILILLILRTFKDQLF